MKDTIYLTNQKGRTFKVRVVCEGDEYGRENCLIHDGAPMVEFFDAHIGPHGQFVSRYYLSTLQRSKPDQGIILEGSQPECWTVSARNKRDAIDFALMVAERKGALYPENERTASA